jgi:FMN phosphatase YigB (HAD superfamily)
MPIPRPPKAVTFDCWSTLIADQSWEETRLHRQRSLVEIAARRGLELDLEQARELIEGSWQQHVESWRSGGFFGAPGAARWIVGKIQTRGLPIPASKLDADLVAELVAAIENATDGVGTQVVEGAAEALNAVRAAGISTALVCDVGFTPGRFVRRFLKEHGLQLDHYFFSDEVGTPKPYPPIFQAALKATGAEPSKAVHIGDLKRTDVAGARNAGMGTIRFVGVHNDQWQSPDTAGEEADAVLERWADLPEVLGI